MEPILHDLGSVLASHPNKKTYTLTNVFKKPCIGFPEISGIRATRKGHARPQVPALDFLLPETPEPPSIEPYTVCARNPPTCSWATASAPTSWYRVLNSLMIGMWFGRCFQSEQSKQRA